MRPLAAVLLLALLASPAAARPTDEDYREQAQGILERLDGSVRAARTATVEHVFGDRNARQTAHAMRVEGERLDALATELAGLHPTGGHARAHRPLVAAVDAYRVAFAAYEACYRGNESACGDAQALAREADDQRDLAAGRFGVRDFS